MIAAFPAIFAVLYTVACVAALAIARRTATRLAPAVTSGWRWWTPSISTLFLILAVARPTHWLGMFAVELLLTGWLLMNAAVELWRPSPRPRLAWAQLYVGLVVVMGVHLAAQGYVDEATGLTPAFKWVLHELLGVFTLPWVAWLMPSWADPSLVDGMMTAAVATLMAHLPLLLAAGLHGFAWLAVAILAPATVPAAGIALLPNSRLSLGLLPLALGCATLMDDPSSTPSDRLAGDVALAMIAPLYAAHGLILLHQLAAPLRARAVVLLLVVSAFPFLPLVVTFLVSLGYLDHVFALRWAGRPLPQAAPVAASTALKGGLWAALALAFMALPGALANTSQGPPFEPAPECSEVTTAREPGRVRYSAPSGTFAIDVDEHGFGEGRPARTHAAAAAACAAAGARLCTSAEYDLACTCGHAGAMRDTRHEFQATIVSKCFGGTANTWDSSRCENADGVADLLSGRVELLADAEASGAHLLAGATLFVGGHWNLFCGYRSRAVDGTLRDGDWPWVGYRCCTD